MAVFTDADLDGFAAFATELALKDTCDILREGSSTKDGEGGEENMTWPVFASVPCMLTDDRPIPTETLVAERLDGKTIQTVWVPRGTAVLKSDILRVNGALYHIIEVSTHSYEILKPISVWRTF